MPGVYRKIRFCNIGDEGPPRTGRDVMGAEVLNCAGKWAIFVK